MRIAVMGAGAVGGYFGARLADAGQEVVFIGRGEHLSAMRREGLRIRSTSGDLHIRGTFAREPADVGPVDAILFCVKSYDTEAAGKEAAPLVGEKTLIVSLQNGVDNGDRLAELWGHERVLAGVVFLAAKIVSPGVIEHSPAGEIVLGALDRAPGEKAAELQQIFGGAGVPCRMSPEIRKELWKKLVWNAPFCAISCLTGETVKTIVESDSLRKMALGCMEEVLEAARVQGVPLDDTVPDACLSFSRTIGDFKPSMLQDLESGKPLEHEAFNGLVVRILLQAGKKAPINQVFYGTLKFLDQRNRSRRKVP